ncbi:MAG: hypothetical protein IKU39_02200 [Lachnospiraceae bacterium]|nr:hypothetical protein [Lachnospiraceae bacterium]
MQFHFVNRIKPMDFWKMSMTHTYRSLAGVVNIIFTVAMMVLYYNWGNKVHDIVEVLILVACMWFPFFHPLFVYLGARGQAAQIPVNLELEFDDWGMHISADRSKQHIAWRDIKSAVKQYNMIFIRSDAKHGYVLNNKMMGAQKEEFWTFLQSKVSHN